jgi:anti-sigma factor RsiW
MSCIKDEVLQRFIDHEATEDERNRVHEHLAGCAACAARVGELQHNADRAKAALDILTGEEIAGRPFIATMQEMPSLRRSRRMTFAFGLSAACIAIFLGTTLFLLKNRDKEQVIIVPSIGQEIDANRPAAEQTIVITVIGPDGKVTEYPQH